MHIARSFYFDSWTVNVLSNVPRLLKRAIFFLNSDGNEFGDRLHPDFNNG